jgi:hypothetical protein
MPTLKKSGYGNIAHAAAKPPPECPQAWSVDGSINTSDARDKKNIRDLDYGLKEVMQMHSVKFNWKNSEEKIDKVGLIAQELQKVIPEAVKDYLQN